MYQRDVAALGQKITSHTLQLRAGPPIVTVSYTIVTEKAEAAPLTGPCWSEVSGRRE